MRVSDQELQRTLREFRGKRAGDMAIPYMLDLQDARAKLAEAEKEARRRVDLAWNRLLGIMLKTLKTLDPNFPHEEFDVDALPGVASEFVAESDKLVNHLLAQRDAYHEDSRRLADLVELVGCMTTGEDVELARKALLHHYTLEGDS